MIYVIWAINYFIDVRVIKLHELLKNKEKNVKRVRK